MSCCELLYFAKCSSNPFCQDIFRTCAYPEIIYVKSGTGVLFYDGGKYNVGKCHLIVIPSNVKYRFDVPSDSECYVSGFRCDNVKLFSKPTVLSGKEIRSAGLIIRLMEQELKKCRFNRRQMLNLLFNILILNIVRFGKASEPKKVFEKDNFDFIINFLDAQSQNKINIEKISELSGLSYHRFRHKFKEIVGVSPQQYIIGKRIAFAERLLKTTSYNTASIAKACGFNSVPQFITCFSKIKGKTPTKFRKEFSSKASEN